MKKILIVDDDKDFVGMLSSSLPRGEYLIEHASNGEEALQFIQKNRPDLILLDLRMPHMNGMEFLAEFHKVHEGPEVPVIVATNVQDTTSIGDCLLQGVKGYVTKSEQSMSAIVQTIKNTL